jgi:hypothetical protein
MTYAAQNIAERRQALRNIGKARPTTYRKRPIVAYCSAPLYRKKQANPMPHLYVFLGALLGRAGTHRADGVGQRSFVRSVRYGILGGGDA